jgi:hypothetical protein
MPSKIELGQALRDQLRFIGSMYLLQDRNAPDIS